jgi:hypothetical protein
MYYNMGEVRQWEENNSILNNETALPYLSQLNEYPLPLDLALPLFQWGVLFREGEMIRLINQLDESQLTDRSRFYPIADDRYEVIDNTFLDGTFLYKEDLIRLEKVEQKELEKAAGQLQTYDWPESFYISYYHLDSTVISNFNPRTLAEIVERF